MATRPTLEDVLAANHEHNLAALTDELRHRIHVLTPQQMRVALFYLAEPGSAPSVRKALIAALSFAGSER
jgi:hypothetical protein